MERQYKIALLIDGENVSKKYVKLIMDELNEYGTITHKRVYGDFSNGSVMSWKDNLRDFAMTPVFQFNYTKGKNASDSAMVIDAMDILYSGKVDGFCLVTSDSDFTKLAIRLKEAGMLVIGMGEQKTPNSLVAACETFKFLDLLYAKDGVELEDSSEECATQVQESESLLQIDGLSEDGGETINEESDKLEDDKEEFGQIINEDVLEAENRIPSKEAIGMEITAIIFSKSDEDGWVNLAEVGNLLSKRVPGFDTRNYHFSKLRNFIESFDCYETREVQNPKVELLKIVYVRMKGF